MQIIRFRRFEASRMFPEPRIIDDGAETLQPNLPLSNVRVAIHPRSKIGFGIVQVKSNYLLHANQRVNFFHRGIPALASSNIVPAANR